MPIRSGHSYLLGESSKFHTSPINLQQIASMFSKINAKREALRILDERLTKVEAMREPPKSPTGDQTSPRNNRRNNTDNPSNLDV